jgi:tRNA A37 threonylcarbamoyladenosine biosynthesis protein TsaE
MGNDNMGALSKELSVVSCQLSPVYHFDLYRIEDPGDIFLIGADDIFADPSSICLIEWPEILRERVTPTVIVEIEKV